MQPALALESKRNLNLNMYFCSNSCLKFSNKFSKEKILGVFNRFEKAVKHVQNKAEEGFFFES